MKTSLIIDSRDKQISSHTTTDFHVVLSKKIQVVKASLKSFHMSVGWYNITSDNNQFRITYPTISTEHTLTIATGRYTINEIVASLQAELTDTALVPLQVTRDPSTGIVTLTTQGSFFDVNYLGSLDQVLGFTAGYTDTNVATAQTQPQINEPEYLKLQIDCFPNNSITVDNDQNNYTFVVPLSNLDPSTVAGDHLNFFSDSSFQQELVYDSPIDVQSFRVRLLDRNGTTIDNNGANWYCVLDLELKHETHTSSSWYCG